MSWSVSKRGPVLGVKEQVEQEFAEHGYGNVQEAEKPVALLLETLGEIGKHPHTHVELSAHGHSYHDGNHREFDLNIRLKTIHPSNLPGSPMTPDIALA